MRIATFNVENLDETGQPALAVRIQTLRPQLRRLRADVLCLQEIHGQERAGEPRAFHALDAVIADTPYATFNRASTRTATGQVYDQRNLVVLSRYPVEEVQQYQNRFVPAPAYRKVMALPVETVAKPVEWERPILHVRLASPEGPLHVINLHLKSRLPSAIAGQQLDAYRWRTAAGWAEGYFLSSMKRVGQALEVRMLIDTLFDADPLARIVVCGDFNSEPGEVAVDAILGGVENTGNAALVGRQLIACDRSIPSTARYTHLHRGHGNLLDHILISRALLPRYRGAEIHNETLHDESTAGAGDDKFPESDHAPFVLQFDDA
jgi:endonuclease/exonuclease/phosphatase family metal-dependent hydrolase